MEKREIFTTNPVSLQSALQKCHDGEIKLPDFQRRWVWDEERIKSIIASIANFYPIGALMALEAGGPLNLESKCIEGVPAIAHRNKAHTLILDGQQRLTSLYQVTLRDNVVDTISASGKKISRWFYIDIQLALDDLQDVSDAILSIPSNKIEHHAQSDRKIKLDLSSPEKEFENLMYPVAKVFDWDEWQDNFCNYWDKQGKRSEKRELFLEFKNKILKNFDKYHLQIMTLVNSLPKEAVCTVFEKVNTTGKPLDSFELLTAMYAGKKYNGKSFNLLEDWYGSKGKVIVEGKQEKLAKILKLPNSKVTDGLLANVDNMDYLKVISLLNSFENDENVNKERKLATVTCTRKSILNLKLEDYKKYEEKAFNGFELAAQFLHTQNIYRNRDIPYQSQLVPLAAILADLGERWHLENSREKLGRWYWNGVFGELYGSSVDTRVAKDFIEVPLWIEGKGEEPTTVKDAIFRADRLNSSRTRRSAVYKGVTALLMTKGLKDFISGLEYGHAVIFDENIDIHHIFPVDWCSKKENNVSRLDYDSIINKTPLTGKSNKKIGGNAPSDYLSKIENEGGGKSIDQILDTHLIDRKFLDKNDFDKFFKDRKGKICNLIESATGKKIHYDEDEDGGEYIEIDGSEYIEIDGLSL